jgi:hypothetical protein
MHSCDKGEIPPDPSKLEPFFERYAVAVFDVEVRERLLEVKSPEKYKMLLQRCADRLLNKITSKKGVWRRVVEDSFEEAHYIGFGNSKDGYRYPEEFARPRKRSVKRVLQLRVMDWHQLAIQRLASDLEQAASRPKADDKPTLRYEPELLRRAQSKHRHDNSDLAHYFSVEEPSTVSRWRQGKMDMSPQHAARYDEYIAILTPTERQL